MTHAEHLLWLAELESERAGYAFHQEGTRLPRFPSLRQPCPEGCSIPGGQAISPCVAGGFSRSLVCGTCQGRGFVPVDNLEATLPCAHEWRFETKAEDIVAMCRLRPISLAVLEHGLIHNEAAISALYKCVIAETKP